MGPYRQWFKTCFKGILRFNNAEFMGGEGGKKEISYSILYLFF